MKTSRPHPSTTVALVAALALASAAFAQTAPSDPSYAPVKPVMPAEIGQPMGTPMPGGDGMPPPPQVRQKGSVDYINGGAGEENRAVMDAKKAQFSLHNVFSGKGGEYVVASKVTIRRAGAAAVEPITINNAGPILMVSLPPGSYMIEAEVDGKMQRKTVTVGRAPVTLNWNWPGA